MVLDPPRRELGDEAGEHAAVLRAPLLPVARGLDAFQQVAEGMIVNVCYLGASARSEEDLDEVVIVSLEREAQGRLPGGGLFVGPCAGLEESCDNKRGPFHVAVSG